MYLKQMRYNRKRCLFKLEMVICAKEVLVQNQMNRVYDAVVTAVSLVIMRELVR